ncbi:hypothetical protein FKP32DRAFT_855624 [Trametes sanguinea]|nr:hypothetical protein FKP32DRAFT_855624 [Trametes sanguinea]
MSNLRRRPLIPATDNLFEECSEQARCTTLTSDTDGASVFASVTALRRIALSHPPFSLSPQHVLTSRTMARLPLWLTRLRIHSGHPRHEVQACLQRFFVLLGSSNGLDATLIVCGAQVPEVRHQAGQYDDLTLISNNCAFGGPSYTSEYLFAHGPQHAGVDIASCDITLRKRCACSRSKQGITVDVLTLQYTDLLFRRAEDRAIVTRLH